MPQQSLPCQQSAHSVWYAVVATLILGLGWSATADQAQPDTKPESASTGTNQHPNTDGMIWIEGGEFLMGSTDPLARADEQPVHPVRVAGFWIDQTEVTNEQFMAFVAATGYETVAERKVDWESMKKQLPPGTPKPAPEVLAPGSLVFNPTPGPVNLRRFDAWWRWTPGANWRQPEGPGSDLKGLENHPVVHIAFEDAQAYAAWAGKQLPTEAQWEYAARGGLDQMPFTWGDRPRTPEDANIWDGRFPYENTEADGASRTAPVGSYPPNGYGLKDMAGNVWEWCLDPYEPDAYDRRLAMADGNPTEGDQPISPRQQPVLYRTIRGGSFLCNDSYCASYRPSARMRSEVDSGLSHVGFRCVLVPENPPGATP